MKRRGTGCVQAGCGLTALIVIVSVVAVVITGAMSSDDATPTTVTYATINPQEAQAARDRMDATADALACTTVPDDVTQWLREGLNDPTTALGNPLAVPAQSRGLLPDEYGTLWYVAATFDHNGTTGVALWATDALDTSEGVDIVLNANDVAQGVSDWFPASKYELPVAIDIGANRALECAKGATND